MTRLLPTNPGPSHSYQAMDLGDNEGDMAEDDYEVHENLEDDDEEEESSLKSISEEEKVESEPSYRRSKAANLSLDISKIHHNTNSSYLVKEDDLFAFPQRKPKRKHADLAPIPSG